MKAYVYLNEGRDHYFGWKPDHVGQLTMVGTATDDDTDTAIELLESVFSSLNSSDGYDHRSFSVGDVIVIDDGETQTPYACEPVGWRALPLSTMTIREFPR